MQKNRLNTTIWKSQKMGHGQSKRGKVDRYDTAYFNVTDCVGNTVLNELFVLV